MIEPSRDLFSSAQARQVVADLARSGGLARLERVHPRPGIDISAVYRVSPTGRIVVSTAKVATQSARIGGFDLHWWPLAQDPHLPGLQPALNAQVVAQWLAWPSAELSITSYRPLRRAVLRARYQDKTAFIKVLTPAKAARLQRRHELLAGLAPNLLCAPEAGVLVLDEAQGVSLANSFVAWHSDPQSLATPASLVDLLDRFPAEITRLRRRKPWTESLGFYTDGAVATLGWEEERIRDLGHALGRMIASSPTGEPVPTHGDFYEANVFVQGTKAVQVIDLDSVGPGFRVDDYACLLGHAAVLPSLSAKHYPKLELLVQEWFHFFSRQVDPRALAARVGGVILTLIVGAPEQATARLALAESWRRRAESL